jgi:hypothetical protein
MGYLRAAFLGLFVGAISGAIGGAVILGASHWINGPSWESPITSANDGFFLGAFFGAIIGLLSAPTVRLVKHLVVGKHAQ